MVNSNTIAVEIMKLFHYFGWKMFNLTLILLFTSVCAAEFYQVNRTRTLCFSEVAEFFCSKHSIIVSWSITTNRGFKQLAFLTQHSSAVTMSSTIDSTPVVARLIFSNSTVFESSLTIVASLSATIQCDTEVINYSPINSEYISPSQYMNNRFTFVVIVVFFVVFVVFILVMGRFLHILL